MFRTTSPLAQWFSVPLSRACIAAHAAASAKKADALDPAGKLSFAWAGTLATFVQNMKLYMEEPLDGTNRGPFVFSGGTDGLPFTPDDLYSFRLSGTGKAN